MRQPPQIETVEGIGGEFLAWVRDSILELAATPRVTPAMTEAAVRKMSEEALTIPGAGISRGKVKAVIEAALAASHHSPEPSL